MGDKYNGYTNYETWIVSLHLSNDEGSQNYWSGRAKWCMQHHDPANANMDARGELADELREEMYQKYDEERPENSILADLLSGALSDVNWDEIAGAFVEDCQETQ